jgi:MFS transporter, ACS family, tartrate transporter
MSLAILVGNRPWLVMELFCVTGLTSHSYQPPFRALPTNLLSESVGATAVGLIALGYLGGFAGPSILGYLKTTTGRYQIGLAFIAGCT